eukprot:GHVU01057681.1.p2 GENE.GHVU01057681.1~~GHVU01057681.1.p2  ORF type:complete len:950 (+),score=80.47 GHVU01057681.1:1774-4623(+)
MADPPAAPTVADRRGMAAYRRGPPPLFVFTGEYVHGPPAAKWMARVRSILGLTPVTMTEGEKIEIMASYLEGLALEWFQGKESVIFTAMDFIREFNSRFELTLDDKYAEVYKRPQNIEETTQAYYEHWVSMCLALGLGVETENGVPVDLRVAPFIKGLRNAYVRGQLTTWYGSRTTLEEAKDQALRKEKDYFTSTRFGETKGRTGRGTVESTGAAVPIIPSPDPPRRQRPATGTTPNYPSYSQQGVIQGVPGPHGMYELQGYLGQPGMGYPLGPRIPMGYQPLPAQPPPAPAYQQPPRQRSTPTSTDANWVGHNQPGGGRQGLRVGSGGTQQPKWRPAGVREEPARRRNESVESSQACPLGTSRQVPLPQEPPRRDATRDRDRGGQPTHAMRTRSRGPVNSGDDPGRARIATAVTDEVTDGPQDGVPGDQGIYGPETGYQAMPWPSMMYGPPAMPVPNYGWSGAAMPLVQYQSPFYQPGFLPPGGYYETPPATTILEQTDEEEEYLSQSEGSVHEENSSAPTAEPMGALRASTMVMDAWVGHPKIKAKVVLDSGATFPAVPRSKCEAAILCGVPVEYKSLEQKKVFSLAVAGEVAVSAFTVKLDVGVWLGDGVVVELKQIQFFVVEQAMPNVLIGSNVLKALGVCPVEALRAKCGLSTINPPGQIEMLRVPPDGVFCGLGMLNCPEFSLAHAVNMHDFWATTPDEPFLELDDGDSSEDDGTGGEFGPEKAEEPPLSPAAKVYQTVLAKLEADIAACPGLPPWAARKLRQLHLEEFLSIYRCILWDTDAPAFVKPMEVHLKEGMYPDKQRCRKMGPLLEHVMDLYYGWGTAVGHFIPNPTATVASCALIVAKAHKANKIEEVMDAVAKKRIEKKKSGAKIFLEETSTTSEPSTKPQEMQVYSWALSEDGTRATQLTTEVCTWSGYEELGSDGSPEESTLRVMEEEKNRNG